LGNRAVGQQKAAMGGTRRGGPRGGGDVAIPQAAVGRLSLYLRELQQQLRDDRQTISSTQLGQLLGFTDAQVRKDLAYFGQFGYPGVGYRCGELVAAIQRILGTDRSWPIAMVGVGNLGRALLGYRGFREQGFRIAAAFDADPAKVGRELEGISVYSMERLPEVIAEQQIKLGILAVPGSAAGSVAETLAAAGLEGILNFAPVTLNLPPNVRVVSVDLAMELEQLSFAVVNRPSNA
jgi:redox-sensing transcriptional repressor